MHTFRVWAPLPKNVQLQLDGRRFQMEAVPGGWWTLAVPTVDSGGDYGFVLDGEGPFPDPRSAWQPQGVHGLSRLVNHGSFPWTDIGRQSAPLSSAVLYELHIGTFTPQGTFEAAIEKLDHLVELGITHVELMPVNEFDGDRGWGYDGVDLYAPHHAYGGPTGLKRLVEACHLRRLGVLLDVVYNHLGNSGNYLSRFGPYFSSDCSTPWGPALNLDGPDSDEVRCFFLDNASMWLCEYHFDGLRIDAVHALRDDSARPFLDQLGRRVRETSAHLGRHIILIAESDLNDPRLLWSRDRGGLEFCAQWNDDFHHALHAILTQENVGIYQDFGSLAHFCKAVGHGYVYDGQFSAYRRRTHGREPSGLNGHRFLAYLQNHDQVGNRAKGDRSSQLMSLGRLKIGAALVFTSPFVPMLFQGEEWGASTDFPFFTNYPEPDFAQAVREGRRREFAAYGWKPEEIPDPQSDEVFLHAKLNWAELASPPFAELLDWHRQLIRLRRAEVGLTDGRMELVQTSFDEKARWLVIERGAISIACNLGADTQRVPLKKCQRHLLLGSGVGACLPLDGVDLAPDSVAILKCEAP